MRRLLASSLLLAVLLFDQAFHIFSRHDLQFSGTVAAGINCGGVSIFTDGMHRSLPKNCSRQATFPVQRRHTGHEATLIKPKST